MLNGTFDPRGLEYFGGRSLILEKGSVFKPEGNIGYLAPLRTDVLTGATVRLQKENCWLRCYAKGVISLQRLELTGKGRIEPKTADLRIGEMFIDGNRVPDGIYDHQSPEMGRVSLAGKRKLTVGTPPGA